MLIYQNNINKLNFLLKYKILFLISERDCFMETINSQSKNIILLSTKFRESNHIAKRRI